VACILTAAEDSCSVLGEHEIPVYDDGYGPLWIHRDSMGILGIVRAQSFEDAYGICEDEFFPEADESIEDFRREYNFTRKHVKMIHPVVNGEIDLSTIRPDSLGDYESGSLRDGQFVKWETIETPCDDENGWAENDLFCEAFGFRSNGPNSTDVLKHGIYAKDLNGDSLDLLTPELAESLGITIATEDEP
jgi:hypothetical protein